MNTDIVSLCFALQEAFEQGVDAGVASGRFTIENAERLAQGDSAAVKEFERIDAEIGAAQQRLSAVAGEIKGICLFLSVYLDAVGYGTNEPASGVDLIEQMHENAQELGLLIKVAANLAQAEALERNRDEEPVLSLKKAEARLKGAVARQRELLEVALGSARPMGGPSGRTA